MIFLVRLFFGIVIIITLINTPSNLLPIFIGWAFLFIVTGAIYSGRHDKAIAEVSCALLNHKESYKECLINESDVYHILKDLKTESDIYEGMSTKDVDSLLKKKLNDRYFELGLRHYFEEISTNKDRFKGNAKVEIKNYRTFPRQMLIFQIKNNKIEKVRESIDRGHWWSEDV